MDDVKYYIGIDFGTTNSAAAAIQVNDNSQGEIPTNENKKIFSIGENQKNPLPSYVAINKATGVIKTGSDAKKKYFR